MSSPLSNELFFEAHRGLSHPEPTPIKKDLGVHWSAKKHIANELATRTRSEMDSYIAARTPEYRTILHAQIPMSSVETHQPTLQKNLVLGSTNLNKNIEEEIPVKKGAPVLLTGMTKVYRDPLLDKSGLMTEDRKIRKRTRTYNPPREMQA